MTCPLPLCLTPVHGIDSWNPISGKTPGILPNPSIRFYMFHNILEVILLSSSTACGIVYKACMYVSIC